MTKIILLIAIFSFSDIHSQALPKTLTVENAISTALKNNLELQSQQLSVQSSSALRKSVFELPKTEINFQYGQFNSIQKDNAFEISQTIPFPTYFTAKTRLYKAELLGSELRQQATINLIKAQVQSNFYQLLYLQSAKKQLQSLDSLLNDFVKAAALRYKSGETNLLEKTTAETKRGQLSLLLKQNETEYAMAYNSLKVLMNTDENFEISENETFEPLTISNNLDTSLINNNPSIKLMYQQAIIAEQNKRVEKSAVLPDFTVGYFNQSLIGTQMVDGEDVFFDRSKRFQGINIGINIPLTFFSNSAKIKSLNYKQQSLLKEAESGAVVLQLQLENAFQQYNQNYSQYNYYKSIAIPNVDIIINTARIGFRSGDIGYIEYTQALQTAIDVHLNALQSVNQLNQSVININFIINK